MFVPSAPLLGLSVRFTGPGAYSGRVGVVTEVPAAGYGVTAAGPTVTAAYPLDARRPGGLTIERTYHVADVEVLDATPVVCYHADHCGAIAARPCRALRAVR